MIGDNEMMTHFNHIRLIQYSSTQILFAVVYSMRERVMLCLLHCVCEVLAIFQAENISLKRRLAEESAARLAAEDRALELARDNRRLQAEMRRLTVSSSGERVDRADEELLSQVEAAFSKFNQFLDLVRDTGLVFNHGCLFLLSSPSLPPSLPPSLSSSSFIHL